MKFQIFIFKSMTPFHHIVLANLFPRFLALGSLGIYICNLSTVGIQLLQC